MAQVGDKYAVHSDVRLREVYLINTLGEICVGLAASGYWTEVFPNQAVIECLPNFKYWTVLNGVACSPYAAFYATQPIPTNPNPPPAMQVGDRFLIKGVSGYGEVTQLTPLEVNIPGNGKIILTGRAQLENDPNFDGWAILGGLPQPHKSTPPTYSSSGHPFDHSSLRSGFIHVGDTAQFKTAIGTVVALDFSKKEIHVKEDMNQSLRIFNSVSQIEQLNQFVDWIRYAGQLVNPPPPPPVQQAGGVMTLPPGFINLSYAIGGAGGGGSAGSGKLYGIGAIGRVSVDYGKGRCQDCGTEPEDRHFSTFSFKFCPNCRKEVP